MAEKATPTGEVGALGIPWRLSSAKNIPTRKNSQRLARHRGLRHPVDADKSLIDNDDEITEAELAFAYRWRK